MSYLAHDDQNALSHADDYFYHFFNSTRTDLDNSFLFVMGDHGNRFGKVRQTNVGEIEDNNPCIFMSAPKNLRRNDTLIDNLRENSKELITHYDIYATMVEIANPSNPRTPDPLIKGSSLFRSLPQPRTCGRLRIPFEYCICNVSYFLNNVNDNKLLKISLNILLCIRSTVDF
jgi:membrane-anchored protein YejM (alkaline phosphatase superfamily)